MKAMRCPICVLAGCAALMFMGVRIRGADQPTTQPAMPSPDQMNAAMEQAAAPGPEQEAFNKLVGDWDAKITMWFPDPSKPEVSSGKGHYEVILGGRYLKMEFTGTTMGKEFHGLGIMAYDKTQKHYYLSWFDTMGTGILNYVGDNDADGKVLTMRADFPDPMSGQMIHFKDVTTKVDDDHQTYESYMVNGDKEQKIMQIEYTRIKS
jgi:hypothetical protein